LIQCGHASPLKLSPIDRGKLRAVNNAAIVRLCCSKEGHHDRAGLAVGGLSADDNAAIVRLLK
jgi:hypothetical protein